MYRDYALTLRLNGSEPAGGVAGTLRLDESAGRAEIDFGALTLAQLLTGAAITHTQIAGGFSRVSLVDGENETSTHQITCTGMAAGDEIVAVLVLTAKASIATAALHAGTLTAATDKITPGTEVNNTGNQYVIFWNDLT